MPNCATTATTCSIASSCDAAYSRAVSANNGTALGADEYVLNSDEMPGAQALVAIQPRRPTPPAPTPAPVTPDELTGVTTRACLLNRDGGEIRSAMTA
jgi:hypothetical protein